MRSQKIVSVAGTMDVVTAQDFVRTHFSKQVEKIHSIVADCILLDTEYPPDEGNTTITLAVPVTNTAFWDLQNSDPVEQSFLRKTYALSEVDKDPVDFLADELENAVSFVNSIGDEAEVYGIQGMAELVEQIAVRSLENFGIPTYVVEFSNGNIAAIDTEGIECRIAIKDGKIMAGIIPSRNTTFGIRARKMT